MYKVNYLISDIITELAQELDLKVLIEPQYKYVGMITTKDGRNKFFRNTNFDLNSLGASEIAKDKSYAAYFMNNLGYRVPQQKIFFSPKFANVLKANNSTFEALEFAKKIGYPLIVKPNSQSQGVGVEKVHNEAGLVLAMDYIFNVIKDRIAIVENFISGNDYRIVIVDDVLVAAYQRLPLSVVGDSTSTISKLLQDKQKSFIAQGRDTVIKSNDPRIQHKLSNDYKMNLESVPVKGQKINLLDAANLSAGGDALDVTNIIHPTFAKLAIDVTKTMGLRLCGVDIIVDGTIDQELNNNYTIIEINAAPGLDHYAQVGEVQMSIVKDMYKKVIKAMCS